MTRGQEEAAAIVLPNGFQEKWFQEEAHTMAARGAREILEAELEKLVPMCIDMDRPQRDMLVLALGAGLP